MSICLCFLCLFTYSFPLFPNSLHRKLSCFVFFKVSSDEGLISFMTSLATLRIALAFPWQSLLSLSLSVSLSLSFTHGISLTFIMLANAKQKILLLANLGHISALLLPFLLLPLLLPPRSHVAPFISHARRTVAMQGVREPQGLVGLGWAVRGALGPSGAVATAPASGCYAYLSMPKTFTLLDLSQHTAATSLPPTLCCSVGDFKIEFPVPVRVPFQLVQTAPMALPICALQSQPANRANCLMFAYQSL